ncbi:MAG: 16S rRNA (cytidine(1402)-2'-O)-methyltransferase [Rhizomicrobium sp.]|jgi:16S rRNA (cytidine1402-2'-O)-methyltransferase
MGSSEIKSSEGGNDRAERSLAGHNAQNEAAGLYIVATPIGNARDITLRALDVLNACDRIAAEDTRVTAKLLAIHGISKPLTPYNDHNAARERPRLISRLTGGARIALLSDAGTPLISDPGYKLVREALAHGVAVYAIPGPSAALTGLILSGAPTDRFYFAGFLPAKQGERRRALEGIRLVAATLIFFESARRTAETLADMHAILGERVAAIARELTKVHEEVRRGSLAALASELATQPAPRGEITIVVAPPAAPEIDFAKAESLLQKAMIHMPLSAAAELIATALDLPKRAIYERALGLKATHATR